MLQYLYDWFRSFVFNNFSTIFIILFVLFVVYSVFITFKVFRVAKGRSELVEHLKAEINSLESTLAGRDHLVEDLKMQLKQYWDDPRKNGVIHIHWNVAARRILDWRPFHQKD